MFCEGAARNTLLTITPALVKHEFKEDNESHREGKNDSILTDIRLKRCTLMETIHGKFSKKNPWISDGLLVQHEDYKRTTLTQMRTISIILALQKDFIP